MFKIPLVVAQIDERRRHGEHIMQLMLTEINEDERINLGELTLTVKVRPEDESDPTLGFDRKRFEPGDIWYLVKQEKRKEDEPASEPPTVNE